MNKGYCKGDPMIPYFKEYTNIYTDKQRFDIK